VIRFILAHTQLGRCVYAIGNNQRAAYLAGININRKKLIFFGLNGVFVGFAAMLLLSRVGAAQPSTGTGIELQAIGSVVIGGAPMSRGKGNVVGTFCAVLLWGVIGNALNMMRVNPYIQDVIIGLLIIFAVAVSSLPLRAERAMMEREMSSQSPLFGHPQDQNSQTVRLNTLSKTPRKSCSSMKYSFSTRRVSPMLCSMETDRKG
jgi:ribose/xylose/arabinose/galactoside ABC-type transport system permease subunit